jgi:predicted transcriptional regulator of viral defense system
LSYLLIIVRNNHIFLTEEAAQMQPIAERILTYARSQPEGALLAAKELLHLGSRAAVDQALKRLEQRNELMRLGRGLYVLPVKTRFGIRAPAPEKVIERLAFTRAETIVPHGAAAANTLGLTTQVPVKHVYLTSGPSRHFKLGAQAVELRHAPQWMLLPTQPAAGEAVRALEWLGKKRIAEGLTQLKRKLPECTLRELVALRPAFPAWMAKSIGQELLTHG